ncbi:MAG: DUF4249 domain-containing protein [Bacteroidia bacterium]
MVKRILKYTGFCSVLLMAACTKNINLVVPQAPNQIVVEGHIEPDSAGSLFLSHNFNYYGVTSFTGILTNDVVHGAHISISDGTTTDTMIETNPSIGYYQNKNLKGVVGKTYYLTVVAEGQTLTASTTILTPIPLQSLWYQAASGMDSLGYLWATVNDPATGSGNYYRWLARRLNKVNGKDEDTTFVPPSLSVFSDQTFKGQKFQFFFGRGSVPGSKAADDTNIESGYFKLKDTVIVKFCTIDYNSYHFYSTYYYQVDNSFNPLSSPVMVQGNINGGLGIWCGYGSSYDTVICK